MRLSAAASPVLIGLVCLACSLSAQEAPSSPSAPPDAEPALTGAHDRAVELGHQLTSPQGFAGIAFSTFVDHVTDFPKEWPRNFEGTAAKRLGSEAGQFVLDRTIAAGVSALHHEDPRYFRMPGASAPRRIGHAITAAFVARKSDGAGSTIALGHLAGAYGSWSVAQLWEPRSASGTYQFFFWGTANMVTKTFSNTFREFWPDVKRKLFPAAAAN